jgi:hypothetical protein
LGNKKLAILNLMMVSNHKNVRHFVTICTLSFLGIFFYYHTSFPPLQEITRRNLFEWGGVYTGGAISRHSFPKMDCKFLNSSTCCSALVAAERPTTIPRSKKRSTCQITKVYHPSPYEINQLAKAEEIAKNTNPEMRLNLFREFIESPQEIEHAKRWLRRVAKRQPGTELEKNDVDRYYLSRFKVTEVCPTEPKQTSWWEYIEPLTVHARHPFAFQRCLDSKNPSKRIPVYVNISLPVVSKTSVDYLLLSPDRRRAAQSSKTFLLDAGTSRFDSSLNWFVCAYQQVCLSVCLFVCLILCHSSSL